MSRAVTPTLRLGCTYTAAATSAGRTVRRQVFTSSTASRALPQEQQRAGRGSSNFGSGRCRVFASMVAASDEVTRKVKSGIGLGGCLLVSVSDGLLWKAAQRVWAWMLL